MSKDAPGPPPQVQQHVLLLRPEYQLRSLPVNYRWEVTRRHPYYQKGWRKAKDYLEYVPPADAADGRQQIGAIALLYGIGVTGVFPDPSTPFDQLEAEQLESTWLSGAVHPLTFAALAALLINALPKDTLGELANLFAVASCSDELGQPPAKVQMVNELFRSRDDALKSYPDAPYVSLNPAASERQVSKALHGILSTWKERYGLPEQRDRSDKYGVYLSVWDRREGWANGRYDSNQEHLFKEIAQKLAIPISTVSNHYRSAFELITGHPYSRESWVKVFGPLKLSGLYSPTLGRVSRTRPLASPTRRPIDETTLATSAEGSGPVSSAADFSSPAFSELLDDIDQLLQRGRSNQEIVDELDLRSPAASAAIEVIRRREIDDL